MAAIASLDDLNTAQKDLIAAKDLDELKVVFKKWRRMDWKTIYNSPRAAKACHRTDEAGRTLIILESSEGGSGFVCEMRIDAAVGRPGAPGPSVVDLLARSDRAFLLARWGM